PDAYRSDLAPYGSTADAMSLALRGVGRRVEDHADAMRRLAAELVDLTAANRLLVDEVFGCTEDARRWQARAATGSAAGDPGLVEEGRALQLRCDDVARRVRTLDTAQTAWWERVGIEETAMVDAFGGVVEVDQVEQRYDDATDPADVALATRPGRGAPSLVVLAWWRGLTRAQRQAVLVAAPGAVGNLDGVPADARDEANRLRLARDLATLRHLDDVGQLAGGERDTLDNAEATEDALDRHATDVDAHGRHVPSYLWIYDPGAYVQDDGSVDGRVAIAVGDPDTADAIAVNVPGIKTEAADIGDDTDRAWELHQSATAADPDRTYSSIAWLGYDAPRAADDLHGIEVAASSAAADRGGDLLARSIDGLHAVAGDDADVVPIGHSYGSVALGSALTHHDLGVTRAVVVGSPGMGEGVHDVGDLHLGRGRLFVGQNQDDVVAGLGQNGSFGLGSIGHGQDPADSGFGSTRFQANAGEGHDDHSAYYDNDSESLHNLGAILAGRDPEPAGSVHDPWWRWADDPERDAPSDLYDTDQDGDTDGVPRRRAS
ncbi:alpha/beta hydrolase, partial [Nocardioides plantarum]